MSSTNSPWIFDVLDSDFDTKVLKESMKTPVIVDFWAPWCGPCKALAPTLERLINERKGAILLAKVNTDRAQPLARAYRITSIPAVKAFRQGKVVNEFTGGMAEPQLRLFLDRLVPSQADVDALQAKNIETSNPDEAEKLYRKVLAERRDHAQAILGLSRILTVKGQFDEATSLLERIGTAGEHGAEAQKVLATLFLKKAAKGLKPESELRSVLAKSPDSVQTLAELGYTLAASEKYPEALQHLYSAAEKNRDLAKSQIREVMVKIFSIVGIRNPLSDEYRDKLAKLLY